MDLVKYILAIAVGAFGAGVGATMYIEEKIDTKLEPINSEIKLNSQHRSSAQETVDSQISSKLDSFSEEHSLLTSYEKFEIDSNKGREEKLTLGPFRICAISRITINLATDGGEPKSCRVDVENQIWYLYGRSQNNASIQCAAVCI